MSSSWARTTRTTRQRRWPSGWSGCCRSPTRCSRPATSGVARHRGLGTRDRSRAPKSGGRFLRPLGVRKREARGFAERPGRLLPRSLSSWSAGQLIGAASRPSWTGRTRGAAWTRRTGTAAVGASPRPIATPRILARSSVGQIANPRLRGSDADRPAQQDRGLAGVSARVQGQRLDAISERVTGHQIHTGAVRLVSGPRAVHRLNVRTLASQRLDA
jgi:hypothetical protein